MMYYKVIDNNKDKWILLLHCICSNMNIFDTYIESISEKYNIVFIDLPGHGQSKNSNLDISFECVSNEIIKILDNLSIEKVNIWGISLGAVVAKYLLKVAPNRIDKIIFTDPAFMIQNKFYLSMFMLFNMIKHIFPKLLYLKAFIFVTVPGKKRGAIRKKIYEYLKETDYSKISKWLSELDKEYKNINFDILNKTAVEKYYILGEKDYIFKNGTLKNIAENEYNKIIMKKRLWTFVSFRNYYF